VLTKWIKTTTTRYQNTVNYRRKKEGEEEEEGIQKKESPLPPITFNCSTHRQHE
jgi:hypothetical protein